MKFHSEKKVFLKLMDWSRNTEVGSWYCQKEIL